MTNKTPKFKIGDVVYPKSLKDFHFTIKFIKERVYTATIDGDTVNTRHFIYSENDTGYYNENELKELKEIKCT